jgi:hypothetical protein
VEKYVETMLLYYLKPLILYDLILFALRDSSVTKAWLLPENSCAPSVPAALRRPAQNASFSAKVSRTGGRIIAEGGGRAGKACARAQA